VHSHFRTTFIAGTETLSPGQTAEANTQVIVLLNSDWRPSFSPDQW